MKEVKELKEVKEGEAKAVRSPIKHYTDLIVYKQAYRLALEVSRLTRGFPKYEQYGLASQLRRSARSVVASIVEGWAKRNSPAEFKRHLVIAKGECTETELWIDLSRDEGFATPERCALLKSEYGKLGMMIYNLWKEWRKL